MTRETGPPVKATTTSIRVIESLKELQGATVTDLAEHMKASKSSIHNHLDTLEQLGFVVRKGWTYHLSHRFLELGDFTRRQSEFYRVALPKVHQLANASGFTSSIVVFEREQGICLYSSMGKDADENFIPAGSVLPLHCTAAGKALLSELPDETVDMLLDTIDLEAYTENTLTTPEALQKDLKMIQPRGLAFDREEWMPNVRSIATPISDTDGELLGAICVTSSTDSMEGKRFQQDAPGLIISSANTIRRTITVQ